MYFQFFQSVYLRYAAWQSSTFSVKNSCRIPITLLVILKKNIISNFSHLLGNISFRQICLAEFFRNSDLKSRWLYRIPMKYSRHHYENALCTYQHCISAISAYRDISCRIPQAFQFEKQMALPYVSFSFPICLPMQLAWLSWLRLWSSSRESLPHQRTWATTK